MQVRDKLVAAGEMRQGIDEKREQYRPVATRGAVMYFTVVDLSHVNVMYQTSLDQFRVLFDRWSDELFPNGGAIPPRPVPSRRCNACQVFPGGLPAGIDGGRPPDASCFQSRQKHAVCLPYVV